jgi:excisionase family DNA binding protein
MLQELMSCERVAECLDVSVRTIHALVRSGKLQRFQVGRKRRFNEDQLKAYLEAHKTMVRPKLVDKPDVSPVSSSRKSSHKGGEKRKSGDMARAQLREEMRQWQ